MNHIKKSFFNGGNLKHLIITIGIFLSPILNAYQPKKIKTIEHPKPAFLKVNEETNMSLYVSTFKFMGGDSVTEYQSLENILNQGKISSKTVTQKIIWPNEIEQFPDKIEGEEYLVIASGFFPPTKNVGAIYLLNKSNNQVNKITKDKKGWWYHRVRFWDYDGDGIKDIVTARAFKGMIRGKGAELLVLLAPNGQDRTKWEEQVLFKGPDVFFELTDLNNDGRFEVLASQYLNKKITLHHDFKSQGQWEEIIIDDQIGEGFDLSIIDLNNDGKEDILVTNHVNTKEAGVFAFEFPANLSQDKWMKHIIHRGFKTTARGIGQASPGNAKAFFPISSKKGKPSIVVSGDGNQNVHLFTPTSNNWEYQHDIIYKGKGIIGKVTTADADKDGKSEIYIPAYDENKIIIFEY